MDCVNHGGVTASAFCQNCGRPLCPNCVRTGPSGQILCDPCVQAWQAVPNPFIVPPANVPNPSAAAVLGLIPGVGAMYNGQFFKGLIHVVIFAVLISITEQFGLFGIFIGAWVLYQSFEAFHTAKARRDGQPLPDPLGLNEVGNWLNLGSKHPPSQPGAAPPTAGPYAGATPSQPPYQAPYDPGGQAGYQPGYQPGYQGSPYTPYVDPNLPPGPPPPPPAFWHRREPMGAIVLIALGLLFLLNQVSGVVWKYSWPVFLIGLGVWLMIRRMDETKGGPK